MKLTHTSPFTKGFYFPVLILTVFFAGAPAVAFAGPALSHGEVRERVLEEFHDTPILADIAKCESRFRQYTKDGSVLYGGWKNGMVGVMQIHERVHAGTAKKLGYNVETLYGNLLYAKYLYQREGTSPWRDSAPCWRYDPVSDGAMTMAVADGVMPIPKHVFTEALVQGMTDASVAHLQSILNAHGFVVAEDGQGSPGKETKYFGKKTFSAVGAFQCDRDIACNGDPGFGRVGPRTRNALNALLFLEADAKDSERSGSSEDSGQVALELDLLEKKLKAMKQEMKLL